MENNKSFISLKLKIKLRARKMGESVVIATQVWITVFASPVPFHSNKPGMVALICNSNAGQMEIKGSCGLLIRQSSRISEPRITLELFKTKGIQDVLIAKPEITHIQILLQNTIG